MSSFESDNALPESFSGIVRLFPLPNLVLFPGVIQALHIFEPRYRKLMEDTLQTDQLITLALTEDDSGVELEHSPPLYSTVCIGKVITHNCLEDGRYNLLLMGIQRAAIVEELAADEPYRVAKVEILKETCNATVEQVIEARKELINLFRTQAKKAGNFDEEMLANLSNPELPFGMLVDLICFSTGAGTEFMQQMLSTLDVWDRSNMLLALLNAHASSAAEPNAPFPPDFSSN